jgi:hypothetical protein
MYELVSFLNSVVSLIMEFTKNLAVMPKFDG